jgi:hypothetical protein
VSLFVLSPDIEEQAEVEVATRRSTRRPSTFNDIHILFYFKRITKKKSDMNSFICFVTIFKI